MKQQRTQNPFDKTDLTPQPPSLRGKGEPDSAVINKFVLVPSPRRRGDRKSTRLNSSHANISYAVFCLKIYQALTRPAPYPPDSEPSKTMAHMDPDPPSDRKSTRLTSSHATIANSVFCLIPNPLSITPC